ncbi:MAG TPA: DUF6502 family protein [Steroidobacteraceae bacterium]|jgi:hypothetical protein|nr:DUF6502 family protein [Steroidobacteraceae bacterium]
MTESYRAQLVHTLRTVLRPLVQILFRAGVRFDEFVDLLRGIYAEITIRDALIVGKKISTGRISILSGVPKRDVDRLMSSDDWLRAPKPTDTAALAAVLHRWHTDSAFLGPYGVPLELPLVGQAGRNFTDLVGGSPIPIDANYAYEQLLAANMIARSGETHFKVLSRTYVMPEPLSPAMLEHFGGAMTNLASTLNFNMTPDQKAKRLEQSVFPDDGLPEELLVEFDAFVRERARELISEVDDWLAAASRRPIKKPVVHVNTGLSIFHYVSRPEQRIELEKQVILDQ